MNLQTIITAYLSVLLPDLQGWALESETISRSASNREYIETQWDKLSPKEKAKIIQADAVLLANAEKLADWWIEDEVSYVRERDQKPFAHWWWWIDKIAQNDYPVKYLPNNQSRKKA